MLTQKLLQKRLLWLVMAGWLALLIVGVWTNFRLADTWPIVSWGWEGDLFYIFYNHIKSGRAPYIDFFIEYPPLVAYFIALPWAFLGRFVELSTWDFRALFVLGVGCWLLLLLWWQARVYESLDQKERKVTLILWLTFLNLAISYNVVFARFDVFPAMLTLAGFSVYLLYQKTLRRQHLILAASLVVLAGFLKIYPFVLAPMVVILEVLQKRYQNLVWFGLVFGLILAAQLPFLVWGEANFQAFLAYQQTRGIQIESLYAGPIFWLEQLNYLQAPISLQNGTNAIDTSYSFALAKWAQPVTFGFLATQFFWLVYQLFQKPALRQPPFIQELLALFAPIFILTFILFNFIFSPQYLVWLILLIPLMAVVNWSRNRKTALLLAGLTILASFLTWLIYPIFYEALKNREAFMVLVLNFRNLSLIIIWLALWKVVFDRVGQLSHPEPKSN
jgi:hypothetical protein